MAELAIPSVSQQILLVARLRWMLFRNSLRSIKGRLEAVSSAILWLMMGGLVFGGSIFFGIATYWLVRNDRWQWFTGLLWIVFLFWQIYPIFAASVGAQFDFANLLRFPLRFPSFLILSLIYGLFDPGAVASGAWLFAMWVGFSVARPGLILWALIVLLAFAALNLFFARMLFVWIDKWLARRRTREILGFIFILILLCLQLIGPTIQHFQHHHKQLRGEWIMALLPVASALPAGVAAKALQSALAGALVPTADSFIYVLFYAAAFFWLFRVRLASQFRGENLSETSVPRTRTPVQTSPVAGGAHSGAMAKQAGISFQIPGFSHASSAVFAKEIRYAMRSGPMLLNFLVPVILVVFLGFTFRQQGAFRHVPLAMAFPIAIAYTFLIQMNWVFNSFAYESTGIQFFLLAPVRFRDIMVGKNLFLALMSFIDALLVWAAVAFIFAPPPAVIVVSTFIALLYATLGNLAVGNLLSVCFPRRLEFGAFRQKKQAGVTMAVALVTEIILIGIGALVFALTRFFHREALAVLIFIALSIVTAIAYRISLGRVDALVLNHRETLTAELCRTE